MYTGNTPLFWCAGSHGSVYPCVYREHVVIGDLLIIHFGLSLCIQGTLLGRGGRYLRSRFIPVYTGNTWIQMSLLWHLSVYPCVYREHFELFELSVVFFGLSLCIQGTLKAKSKDDKVMRFIPVYTGNTPYCIHTKTTQIGLSLCIQGTR